VQNKTFTYTLLILISFIWASSFIVVKSATEEIDPIDLGFLRFVVATPLLFLILIYQKKNLQISKNEIPSLIVLGLTGVTLLYLFQYFGIFYTTASTSAVLINTNVIFIAILSIIFLKENLSFKRISGILLSFIGVCIVIFSDISIEDFSFNNIFLFGSVLVLLSAFCWAIYTTVGKKLLKKYDTIVITSYTFALGTIFYVPLVISDIYINIQHYSMNVYIYILYLAIFCSVIGYIGWYYALKDTEASKVAVFLNLIPMFAIIMSFLLGENITLIFIIGAIFIIYGVYLTQKS
jgi:drug/metabolite transporter (DMT)-like permease